MLGSPVDIAIVAGLILIVFGPKKVPELGKALGQGIGNFKKALTEASDEVKAGMASVDDKAEAGKPAAAATPAVAAAPTASAPAKDESPPQA
jgi:sec-independent protein translocase protein TatA